LLDLGCGLEGLSLSHSVNPTQVARQPTRITYRLSQHCSDPSSQSLWSDPVDTTTGLNTDSENYDKILHG